jgi:hypothetical protein
MTAELSRAVPLRDRPVPIDSGYINQFEKLKTSGLYLNKIDQSTHPTVEYNELIYLSFLLL